MRRLILSQQSETTWESSPAASLRGGTKPNLANLFRNNGTAAQLDKVPTEIAPDFQGRVFSDNGMDIDNRCEQPLQLSRAIFE